jgi:hypothetical protein
MVKAIQCDNGREFDNSSMRTFFLTHGIHLRMSFPYTSPQNSKGEHIIRTINNAARSLLFQASLPPYWVEALHTATRLLNILPTKTLKSSTSRFALFGVQPSYGHLRVFGCYVILTFQQLPLTSLLLVQPCVSFSDIPLITKGTAALTYNLTDSSSLAMWCLMRPCSRSPHSRPPTPRIRRTMSSLWITLTLYRLPLDPYSLYLQVLLLAISPSHGRPLHDHIRSRPPRLRHRRRSSNWSHPRAGCSARCGHRILERCRHLPVARRSCGCRPLVAAVACRHSAACCEHQPHPLLVPYLPRRVPA